MYIPVKQKVKDKPDHFLLKFQVSQNKKISQIESKSRGKMCFSENYS